jgi:hypothetical protein
MVRSGPEVESGNLLQRIALRIACEIRLSLEIGASWFLYTDRSCSRVFAVFGIAIGIAIGIYNSKFPQFPTHLVVLGQHTLTWLAF